MTGTFTAAATGLVPFDILNWKDGASSALNVNFIDNISVRPDQSELDLSVNEISCARGGRSRLTVAAGKAYTFRPFVILVSLQGTWPGVRSHGVDVPVNVDSWTHKILGLVDSPYFVNFRGTLDAYGNAAALFDTCGPVSHEQFDVGRVIYFDCVVLKEDQTSIVIEATQPGHVLLVP